jgi:VIT1/CCC1 family predicted Fe2+/Mn2+ transporter
LRVSNAIAVAMLFVTGVAYGRCIGRSPWGFGIAMVVVGVVLVALTMALGG